MKRLRVYILAWLCLQKDNQAWCPKRVSGASQIWANMQFVCLCAHTHIRWFYCGDTHSYTHPVSQTHNAYDANKQTGIQIFFLCVAHSFCHEHTCFFSQKQVGYSYFRLFQREMCIKADLKQPDSGLMCRHSAVFRDSNALTPKGCTRAEGEHYKC